MTQLFAATRKGLFTLRRGAGSRWSIAARHFLGEPVSAVLPDARDGTVYAALRMGHFGIKMRRSADGGATWQDIACPALPAKPTDGPWADDQTPWSVDQVWTLAAGGANEPGTIYAGTLPAALFVSRDRGDSWQLLESLWLEPARRDWFGGGYDWAGIHSVCVDPRDSRRVLVAISCGGVWRTEDGGASWTQTAHGMEADYMPPERRADPNIQDPHRMVMSLSKPDVLWVQHHFGRYRSADFGRSWTRLAAGGPSDFGFGVLVHPEDPDRAWFVPAQADTARFACDGKVVVTRTGDGGKSFTSATSGLPQDDAYHLVYRHAMAIDAKGANLAIGSTTGGLWTSTGAGARWKEVSRDLPPIAALAFGD